MTAVHLGSVALTSDAGSMVVNNLDQSYRDLLIIWSLRIDNNDSLSHGYLNLNGPTYIDTYWKDFNDGSAQYNGAGSSTTTPLLPAANNNSGTGQMSSGWAIIKDYSVSQNKHTIWYYGAFASNSATRYDVKTGVITATATQAFDLVRIYGYTGSIKAGSKLSVYGTTSGSGGATISS